MAKVSNAFKTIIWIARLSALFIITQWLACEPAVTFNSPQPPDSRNLRTFPDRIQGQYVSLVNHSVLTINRSGLLRFYSFDYKISDKLLDSSLVLTGDSLLNQKTHERSPIRREGDSIIVHVQHVDTLFQIDTGHVVRKYKGYYYLNSQYGKTAWEVKRIQLTNDRLIVSSIKDKAAIDYLQTTGSTADTIPPYHFTVTKEQFKAFIKNDGFSNGEVFMKMKQTDHSP